jgi:hypothetical protein
VVIFMFRLLKIFLSVFLLLPSAPSVMAQGSGNFCLKVDQNERCAYSSADECNAVARYRGGYCQENFRLYGNSGRKRYCLATSYGIRCIYNTRTGCVNAAGALGDQGAACVDNYTLTSAERRSRERQGASDCDATDFTCQAGAGALGSGQNAAKPSPSFKLDDTELSNPE